MRNFYPLFFLTSFFSFFSFVYLNDIVKKDDDDEEEEEEETFSRQNKSGQRLKVFQKRQERST